ncbi:unnamed protein product [Brachionus calyciflorus]|uniref:BZIP domain-containing protein n=1 Tax=Brachionus calyciflorus TaxID=104777 RepID=A0A813PNK3_9BILA|nr:unnamed protein product [Brachionus calyciflorus]
MLKFEPNTKTSSESTPSISPPIRTDETSNEDRLSLLVKAAEKLVDEEKEKNSISESTHTKNSQVFNYPVFIGKNGKPLRPFKAYPKESLSLPIGGQSTSFNIPNETNILNPIIPLNVNTNLSTSFSSNSNSSSSSNSPLTITNNLLNDNNKNVISTENLLSLLTTLLASQQNGQTVQSNILSENKLANKIDLTSLNLSDLTTFDIASLSFNSNDFCVQHRKRIQQAQERLLKKQSNSNELITSSTSATTPRRRNSSNGSRKRINEKSRSGSLDHQVVNENQVDSTCSQNNIENVPDEYMNYPPKKRHRIQQEQLKKNEKKNDEEPSSSICSQLENKNETLENSPTSTTKPPETNKITNRSRQSSADDGDVDAYKERRRKNNEAAKRSRDARRAKEDDIALRAALLERENLQLKVEIAQLKEETSRLRCLLYNS